MFELVSVAEEIRLRLAFVRNPEVRFCGALSLSERPVSLMEAMTVNGCPLFTQVWVLYLILGAYRDVGAYLIWTQIEIWVHFRIGCTSDLGVIEIWVHILI